MLIIPTGIDSSALDPSWIANLNSFGSKRGEIAHTSKKPSDAINPQDELRVVRNLIAGLKELDERICMLL